MYMRLDQMITLNVNKLDDPQFIGLVSNILHACVNRYHPSDVYVVEIDHCFDRKWQRFSGKVLGALGTWNRRLVETESRARHLAACARRHDQFVGNNRHINRWTRAAAACFVT